MAKFDHWMKFHLGDYLADTLHLSTLQHGIYIRLLMHCFKHGGLPDDASILARIAGLELKFWRRASPPVMALFTLQEQPSQSPNSDSRKGGVTESQRRLWKHKRVDAERLEAARNVVITATHARARDRGRDALTRAATG